MLLTTFQTCLSNKYKEVKQLLDKKGQKDPAPDSYKLQCKVIELLKEMKCLIKSKMDIFKEENVEMEELKMMLAVVLFKLGRIYYQTEDFKTAEISFKRSLELLSKQDFHPDTILLILFSLNDLGLIWFQRDNPDKARENLESAEKIYKQYIQAFPTEVPVEDWIFHSKDEEINTRPLDSIHALTTFYLAQVYKSLNFQMKSVLYCHTTLRIQLNFDDLDKFEWAVNAATLSHFFLDICCFKEARHHLAAASFMLKIYEAEIKLQGIDDKDSQEKLQKQQADIARSWIKYGLLLLSLSVNQLVVKKNSESPVTLDIKEAFKNSHLLDKEGLTVEELQNFEFSNIETSDYEARMSDKYATSFDDARKIFLFCQECLETAKNYYTLNTHASDMIQLTQDHSQMYRHLCFLEKDDDRKCRMLKRRLSILDPIQSQLNPQYYLDSCREMWYEMAQISIDMLDLKITRFEQNNNRKNTAHDIAKINGLADNIVKNFLRFLDSFNDRSTGSMPEKYPEEMTKPCLNAYFNIARIYQKKITSKTSEILKNNQESLKYYSILVEYCNKNDYAKEIMQTEYSLCADMQRLLPLKIDQLAKEANSHH